MNLKLRQTSPEIERILEYDSIDAKEWRIKKNILVICGCLEKIINAYQMEINYVRENGKFKVSLFGRRDTMLYDLQKYQVVRPDIMISMKLSKDDRVLLLFAKILLEFRAYSLVLNVILQIEE